VFRHGLFSSRGRDNKLRASDADRDQAVAQLADHHAAGRLDFEQFTNRVSQVLASKTLGELNLLFHDLPMTAKPRTTRMRDRSPAFQYNQAPWRFRLHLAAYILSCGGFVWVAAFGYWPGLDSTADWPLIPFLGWGAAVAWHGLTASRQRQIARPNG
jgi:hypothetical protein